MSAEVEAAALLAEAETLAAGGASAEAASLYAAVMALLPDLWLPPLRQAELLRAEGQPEAALLLAQEAARLAPDEPLVRQGLHAALAALGRAAEAPPLPAEPTPPAMMFDVSDLLDYFRAARTPTGIQRVQANILREMLAAGRGAACAYEAASGAWKPLPDALFLELCALSRAGGEVQALDWRLALAKVAQAMAAAGPCRFAPGGSLVNLGSSWWQHGYMRRVKRLKREHGLRYIPFLYDCIPLLAPQFCATTLVEEFARWFAQLCLLADGVVVISESTKRDFEALRQRLLPEVAIPVFVLPLDADPRLAGEMDAPPAQRARPYVLFVATIEARKNHLQVFQAWAELVRRHGVERVPELVCVGKRGWLAEPALALHAAEAVLQDNVTLLHGIPDVALAGLYRGCLFTLFNSYYEGWGLPVTESIGYGRAVVVADNSSLPESAAGAGLAFRTGDLDDLLAKLETMLFQPQTLAAQEAKVRAVRLRSWAMLAAQLAGHVAAAAAVTLPATRCRIRPGEVWEARLMPGAEPHLPAAAMDLAREGEAWGPLENWGCWVKPGRVALRLPLAAMPGTAPLRVLVQVAAPPMPWRMRLRAIAGTGLGADFGEVSGGPRQVTNCVFEVPASAWPRGMDEVLVEIDAPEGGPLASVTAGDERVVSFGLLHAMVCRADDHESRLRYLEGRNWQPMARL
jgi:glycosyltransferase involved in cell wall biosynthesis